MMRYLIMWCVFKSVGMFTYSNVLNQACSANQAHVLTAVASSCASRAKKNIVFSDVIKLDRRFKTAGDVKPKMVAYGNKCKK